MHKINYHFRHFFATAFSPLSALHIPQCRTLRKDTAQIPVIFPVSNFVLDREASTCPSTWVRSDGTGYDGGDDQQCTLYHRNWRLVGDSPSNRSNALTCHSIDPLNCHRGTEMNCTYHCSTDIRPRMDHWDIHHWCCTLLHVCYSRCHCKCLSLPRNSHCLRFPYYHRCGHSNRCRYSSTAAHLSCSGGLWNDPGDYSGARTNAWTMICPGNLGQTSPWEVPVVL